MKKKKKKVGSGHVTSTGERKSVYRVLVERPKGKRPVGRPRHR
jgi:hypothetical protein